MARLPFTVALLSAGAAAIHAAVAGPHFEEWAPFGILFAAAALGQVVWGALVLVRPSRLLLAAGAAGNAAILGAWALSRTAGLPVGPEASTPEPIAALDAVASAFELGIVVVAAVLFWGGRSSAGRATGRFALAAAVVVASVTGTALAYGEAGHHHPSPTQEHHHTSGAQAPSRS